MRYLLAVVGFLGMVPGIGIIVDEFRTPPSSKIIAGSGFLVAGAVLFALGLAACDIVAAIERSRASQDKGQ